MTGLGWPLSGPVSFGLAVAFIGLGIALSLAAALHLGANLTPLPHPKDDACFVASGPYRLVRHPMYGGVILLALGWAFYVEGVLVPLAMPRSPSSSSTSRHDARKAG